MLTTVYVLSSGEPRFREVYRNATNHKSTTDAWTSDVGKVSLLFAPSCCLKVRSPGLLRIEEGVKKAAVPMVQRYPCDSPVFVICRGEMTFRRPKRRSRRRGKLSRAQGRQPRERYLNGWQTLSLVFRVLQVVASLTIAAQTWDDANG
jgi:hypothetical protein